jgi:hypothetical protein
MNYKVGQIINFRTNTIFGKAIKIYNIATYGVIGWTHSAIIVEVTDDTIIVAEALKDGFVKNEYAKKEIDGLFEIGLVAIGTPKIKLVDVKFFAEGYIGKPYGYLDIGIISLIFILRIFGSKINPIVMRFLPFIGITGAKSIICSEGVSRTLYDASFKKLNIAMEMNKSYDQVTPEDLFRSNQIKWVTK